MWAKEKKSFLKTDLHSWKKSLESLEKFLNSNLSLPNELKPKKQSWYKRAADENLYILATGLLLGWLMWTHLNIDTMKCK